MKYLKLTRKVLFFSISVLATGCLHNLEPTPPPVVRSQTLRPPAEVKDVEGSNGALRQAILLSHPVSLPGARLEFRTILVRPDPSAVFVAPYEGVLEVRTGHLVTISDGQKRRRRPGDMWQIEKTARQEMEVEGELAVLRAIYLVSDRP